jgi:RNA polymerase sigma factor (sigma-70 family)
MVLANVESQRFRRTAVFRSLGLFGFSELLSSEGVEQPAEQVPTICLFSISSLMDTAIPFNAHMDEIREWSRKRLLDAAVLWRREAPNFRAWQTLALKSATVIAWNPYREFGELLCIRCGADAFGRAAKRLRGSGFSVPLETVLDLRAEFALHRLPKAIQSFDPISGSGKEVAWLSTVFFRFALQALLSDRSNRAHIESLSVAMPSHVASPEEALGEREKEIVSMALPRMLAKLSPVERQVLTFYFGLEGNAEATLAQIGERLGFSEYKARTAIVVALSHLAAVLGVQGALDADEFRYIKALFVEGTDPDTAARRLKLNRSEVQAAIAVKFRRVLRARTAKIGGTQPVRPVGNGQPFGERMMTRSVRSQDPLRERILAGLRELREPPRLGNRTDGTPIAWLGEADFSLDAIREVLDRDSIEDLSRRNVPLGWLLAGPGPSGRMDLLEDAALRQEELEKLRQRQWVVASMLYKICVATVTLTEREEEEDHTIERVFRTLTGIGQAIRRTLPMALRVKREATFRLSRTDAGVIGWWKDAQSRDSEALSVTSLVSDVAEQDGELGPDFARALSIEIPDRILTGEIGLPGLAPTNHADGTEASLEWKGPRLQVPADA